jgi:hypothetical protein
MDGRNRDYRRHDMTYDEQVAALMRGAFPNEDTFSVAARAEAARRWEQRRWLNDRVRESSEACTAAWQTHRRAEEDRALWEARARAPKLTPLRVQAWNSGHGWVEVRLPREGVEANATIVLGEDGRVESFESDAGWVAHPANVGLYP